MNPRKLVYKRFATSGGESTEAWSSRDEASRIYKMLHLLKYPDFVQLCPDSCAKLLAGEGVFMTEVPTRQTLKMRLVGTIRRDAPDWTKRDAKTYLSKDFIARRLVPCYPVYVRLGTVEIQNVFHLMKLFGLSKQECNDLGLAGTLALECDHRIVCTKKERVTEGAGPDSVQATITAFGRGIAGQGDLPLLRAAPQENTPGPR